MVNLILLGALSAYSFNLFAMALCNPVERTNINGTKNAAPSGSSTATTPNTNSSTTSSPTDTNSYSPIPPDPNVPAGYQVGMATQDYEPVGQQSICTTNCKLTHPFTSTSGPDPLPAGVFAAAINPALGGGPTDCGPCGSCYSIVQSGTPYCNPDPYDPSCGAPSGPLAQDGVKSIKVLITNHCPNCNDVPGHFDINQAPTGWNNPKIYWKKLDDSECL